MRNQYGGINTYCNHETFVVIDSSLLLSNLGITYFKFNLPANVTRGMLPSAYYRDSPRPQNGLHMYNFANYISAGSITSDYEKLSSTLMVLMTRQHASETSPMIEKQDEHFQCRSYPTVVEEDTIETGQEAKYESASDHCPCEAKDCQSANSAYSDERHCRSLNTSSTELKGETLAGIKRATGWQLQTVAQSELDELPYKLVSYASVIKSYGLVRMGGTQKQVLAIV